ncbi:MAG: hypothetical protein PVH40_06745 [Gemmatimonadales bacterium]|jgi:hypothetical protein
MLVVGFVTATLGVAFLIAGLLALRRRRFLGMASGVTLGLLFMALAALMATITVSTQGYRALTHEEVAATLEIRPSSAQRFTAVVTLADGRRDTFDVAGDQVYVDAHILKWKPVANLFGLHTAYELDRIGGRYVELDAERDSVRTVYALSVNKPLDMFRLRRRWTFFAPLVDAEYGSGTFLTANRAATLEVRVSTSGLLIRPVEAR